VSLELSYVLPIRVRAGDGDVDELTAYLRWLARRVDLIVVDGSPLAAFRAHHDRWGPLGRHVAPAPDVRCANGKVRGVLTGVRLAAFDRVVVADDDVRHDGESLTRMASALDDADLVRPQNHFDPLPWHARWDTARMLLNRVGGGDYPGTLGVRRSALERTGGYDGDVLFENLELIRTVTAAGGRVANAPDLFVRRRPPTFTRFREQRSRQAYDDWAQPARFVGHLLAGPLIVLAAIRRPRTLLVAAAGRARAGGRAVFDPISPAFAPLWICERAIFAWVAFGRRLLGGGCPYAGAVIPRAATPIRILRRRFASMAAG
jgi:hypothetical protein